MAIVETYQCGHVLVSFDDDAYCDASPEEIQRRIDHMLNTASDILRRAELRKIEAAREQNEPA